MLDPGWEYQDGNGTIHRGNASIAMWTWIRKGFFSPDTQVKRNNGDAWKSIKALAGSIRVSATPQFAKQMLLECSDSLWYWIPPGGVTDTRPYSGYDMVHYLRNSQLPSNALVCRATPQSPVPDRSHFKTFGQLTNEYIHRMTTITENTERVQEDVVTASELLNATTEGSTVENTQTIHAMVDNSCQDGIYPLNNKACNNPAILSDFGELQRRYRSNVFRDTSKEWYIHVNGTVHGPYSCSHLLGWSQKNGLPIEYKLASVQLGDPQPTEFTDLMELLVRAHWEGLNERSTTVKEK